VVKQSDSAHCSLNDASCDSRKWTLWYRSKYNIRTLITKFSDDGDRDSFRNIGRKYTLTRVDRPERFYCNFKISLKVWDESVLWNWHTLSFYFVSFLVEETQCFGSQFCVLHQLKVVLLMSGNGN
jgi:hypothetical protein